MYLSNTPRILNLDADERLLTPEEMSDAVNVRGVSGNEGKNYILKNVEGNTLKSFTLPAGESKVIGTITHEELNNLYYFVANSSGDHLILQYNSVTDTIVKVLQNSILSFSFANIVQGRALLLDNGETLLYFTDNINPIRKINVEKAIKHTNGDADGYPSPLTEQFIEVLKYPPTTKPTYAFATDPARSTNRVAGKPFQFAYRYIYDDNEASAYSPISDVAISEFYFQNSVYTGGQQDPNNNIINLTLQNAPNVCKHIEVIFREGNNGDWKFIDRIPNKPLQSTQLFSFDNSGVYPAVATNETLKLYDNVPIKGRTLDILGNRLFIGNYVDGYDNVEEVGISDKITATPKYYQRNNYFDRTNISVAASVYWTSGADLIRLSFGFDTYTPTVGDVIVLSASFAFVATKSISTAQGLAGSFFTQYVVQEGDTLLSIRNNILSNVIGQNYNGLIVNNFSNVNNLVLEIVLDPRALTLDGWSVSSVALSIANTDSYAISGGTSSSRSFKAGAFHPIAIAYYDRGNRSSLAQKPKNNSPYIKFFSERAANDVEGLGVAHLDIRVGSTPPVWATHYKILYGGNKTVDEFLQYTTLKPLAAVDTGTSSSNNNKIYLPLRGFKGKDDSYKSRLGALVDYNYNEGDRIRIISYHDGTSRIYAQTYLDFKVLGVETFDLNNQPFTTGTPSAADSYRFQGQFLVIENPIVSGWQLSDVKAGTSNWYNNASGEGALFEVYRPFVGTDDLFYETGVELTIANAGTATRSHQGTIRNQSETVSYTIDSVTVASDGTYIVINEAIDDIKIVNGDLISITNSAIARSVVTNVIRHSSTQSRVYFEFEIFDNVTAGSTVSLIENTAAIRLDGGDVWVKPRLLRYNDTAFTNVNFIDVVEDYYANDFVESNSYNKGRPLAYSESAKQVNRQQSITWSDTFFTDTNNNGLSSFNLLNSNFSDLQNGYGSIQSLKRNGDYIVCWQEDRICRLMVDKQIIYTADGQSSISLSNNVLSNPSYYAGTYGTNNPESIAENDGKFYWASIKKGKVCRLSADGITTISDNRAISFFDQLSRDYLSQINTFLIRGGYDKENDEYFITYPSVTSGTIAIDDVTLDLPVSDIVDAGTTLKVKVDIVVSKDAPQPTVASEERIISNITETANELNSVTSEQQDFFKNQRLYVNEADYVEALNETKTDPAYTKKAFVRNGATVLTGEFNILKSEFTLNKTQPNGTTLSLQSGTGITYNTLSFSERTNSWISKWTFEPDYYGSINMRFIAFKDGALYTMWTSNTYSNFFGTQYDAKIDIMVNEYPQAIKRFLAFELQGNKSWDCTLLETNLVSSSIPEATFKLKEGFWYASPLRATTGSNEANFVGLGVISAINSLTITVSGFDIGSTNISNGDTVYKDGTAIGTVGSISGSDITLSSVTGLLVNDFVYVVKSAAIEGDSLKGYYAKMRLVDDSTDYTELFAVRSRVAIDKFNLEE